MRLVPLLIAALLLMIQYPLWLGHGGWMYVRDMEQQLASQNRTNAQLEARNERLAAEVKDLKEGAGAVEERARYELGMLKEGEVFVQIVETPTPNPTTAPVAGAAAAP
jgi:cell division protein FtsB